MPQPFQARHAKAHDAERNGAPAARVSVRADMSTTATSATPAEAQRFPAGIPFIVGNEGAERFSFYGMRAILKTYLVVLYLHNVLPSVAGEALAKAASSKATAVTHLFFAGVYAFPEMGRRLTPSAPADRTRRTRRGRGATL